MRVCMLNRTCELCVRLSYIYLQPCTYVHGDSFVSEATNTMPDDNDRIAHARGERESERDRNKVREVTSRRRNYEC